MNQGASLNRYRKKEGKKVIELALFNSLIVSLVQHNTVFYLLHITFLEKKRFLINDPITLIIFIYILNFHCVSYLIPFKW